MLPATLGRALLFLLGFWLALAVVGEHARAGDSWPQFRAPGGQGRADDAELPLHGSEGRGVRWKSPIRFSRFWLQRGWSTSGFTFA